MTDLEKQELLAFRAARDRKRSRWEFLGVLVGATVGACVLAMVVACTVIFVRFALS